MSAGLRLAAVREHLRGSLWVLPTVSVLAALAAGVLLVRVRVNPDTLLGAILFGGGSDGARGVLQVVAGSIITVATLTFSLTVVALQVAASHFSPRVLRNYIRVWQARSLPSAGAAVYATAATRRCCRSSLPRSRSASSSCAPYALAPTAAMSSSHSSR